MKIYEEIDYIKKIIPVNAIMRSNIKKINREKKNIISMYER